jgi:hypothetical protein
MSHGVQQFTRSYAHGTVTAYSVGDSLGECRIYFLRHINRIGNRLDVGQGRAVIQTVGDDPVLGKEATAILRGRSRNR